MKAASNSCLNRQEQVKVVIRLKPDTGDSHFAKCVYLSERDNELAVEAGSKKEIFVFDHVAHQNSSQMDIYRMIGEEAVQSSLEGYNCCIFAYGQTGAGKTYSVMGSLADLHEDHYCDSRGLLPRIVEDVFSWIKTHQSDKYSVVCSYMEIYNEQIFDLLSPDKRIHQIREDFKRGIFVQGLTEKRVTSYRQGIQMVMEGEKTRKMASTSMNTESSRSHAIFTILIESQRIQEGILKQRKSKINIVDLAGSQRVKHTHVEGERLRQGCNINRSLHVLGNVINSLVESAKKKKHIPFRDSKLTYFLKDSLGGNSITKLLANIHCGKEYFGDTLSTLMFAKRAKILKMKVEINENHPQNFESLRKQVKRLRQELAQARYFKVDTQRTERPSFQQDLQVALEGVSNNTDCDSPKTDILHTFEENELHYKSLIDVYEEHMKTCSILNVLGTKKNMNMVAEWKSQEKKNLALAGLVKRFPAFTRIYKQNLLLKQDKQRVLELSDSEEKKRENESTIITIKQSESQLNYSTNIDELIKHYEAIINEMRIKFQSCIEGLQKSYMQLERDCREKDKRLKEYIKKQNLPPDIEELKNENQYLHLNILNLQNQIAKLQEDQDKVKLQKRASKRSNTPYKKDQQSILQNDESDDFTSYFLQKLAQVKEEAMREAQAAQLERTYLQGLIQQLQNQVSHLKTINSRLQLNTSRYKNTSLQKDHQRYYSQTCVNQSIIQLLNQRPVFEAQYNFSEQNQINRTATRHELQVIEIRHQLISKQQELSDLKLQIDDIANFDRKIEQQFGKSVAQIIQEHRQIIKKQINSNKNGNAPKNKEQNVPKRLDTKRDQPPKTEKKLIDAKNFKMKDIRIKKQEPISPITMRAKTRAVL